MPGINDRPISSALRAQIEVCIEAFESAWQRAERPDLTAYLPAAAPERVAVLVELIHADLEFRLKRGEAGRAEDYLARFPELDAEAAIDLIVAEFQQYERAAPCVRNKPPARRV